jgi:hypothetical protein
LRKLDLQHQCRALMQNAALSKSHRGKLESEIERQLADQGIKPATTRQRGPSLPARTEDDGRHGTRLIAALTVVVAGRLALH